MKTTHIVISLGVALVAQTTLVRVLAGGGVPVDLVLVVVVFAALSRGPVVGLWTGTFAGLLQDALSGGIIGVSGLAKTAVGVLTGVGGFRLMFGTFWHRLAALVAASFVHAFFYLGVYALIGPDGPLSTLESVAAQAAINAGVGVLAYTVVRAAPGMSERLRQGRNPSGRRRWMMS